MWYVVNYCGQTWKKEDIGIIEYLQPENGLIKIKRVNTIKDFAQKNKTVFTSFDFVYAFIRNNAINGKCSFCHHQ